MNATGMAPTDRLQRSYRFFHMSEAQKTILRQALERRLQLLSLEQDDGARPPGELLQLMLDVGMTPGCVQLLPLAPLVEVAAEHGSRGDRALLRELGRQRLADEPARDCLEHYERWLERGEADALFEVLVQIGDVLLEGRLVDGGERGPRSTLSERVYQLASACEEMFGFFLPLSVEEAGTVAAVAWSLTRAERDGVPREQPAAEEASGPAAPY